MEERIIKAIETLWASRKSPDVVVAGGDDCGILRSPGAAEDLLITSDQLVENRHFRRDRHPPGDLGRKALVRSLSDIAAMGGRPLCFLQTICLPDWAVRSSWHQQFQRGLRDAANDAEVSELALLGGDVAGGELFVATVTVIGRIEQGTALLRSGARPGDLVYVSGVLGGSAKGLELLLGENDPALDHPAVRRHCSPKPRLALGRRLRKLPATSAIDISDGLAVDANRLALASSAALVIDAASIPLFPGLPVEDALRSGEEYELLFTVAPGVNPPAGLDVTAIGRVKTGSGVWLESSDGRRQLGAEGFSHFGVDA